MPLCIIALSVRPSVLKNSSPRKTVFSLPTALPRRARPARFLPGLIPLRIINQRCCWRDFFHFLTQAPAPIRAIIFTNSAPFIRAFCERGCKTGSNAYLVWPARVGAFSTVIGSHYLHFDTSSMPFSYLLEEKGHTMLVPGTAIKSVGTVRDEQKWQQRDNRKDPHKLDLIIFDAFSPYTVQNIISGRNQLENIQDRFKGHTPESVTWNNLTIKLPALTNGIELL